MAKRTANQTEAGVRTEAALSGLYLPGQRWAEDDRGVLQWPASGGDEELQRLAQTLRQRGLSGDEQADGVWVYDGRRFVEAAACLAEIGPIHRLAPDLALLVRILRLAVRLVEAEDVVPLAAPISLPLRELFASFAILAAAEDDGWSRWTKYGDGFQAAWCPALTQPEVRALRMLFISEAERCWAHGWKRGMGWHKRDHARLTVDAWLLRCVDTVVRTSLSTAAPVAEAADRGSGWRVLYHGEAELLERWRTALGRDEAAIFSGDGWLVWRMLKRWWAGTGWAEAARMDRSGRDHYHLELELIPPAADPTEPSAAEGGSWRLEYRIAHNHWPVQASLAEWWNCQGRVWAIGRDSLHGVDSWVLPELWRIGGIVPAVRRSLTRPAPSACELTTDEVFELVTQRLPELREQNVVVRTPSVLPASTAGVRIRVRVDRVRGRSTTKSAAAGGGFVGRDQLVEFDWSVVIDERELSRAEFERMVAEKRPYLHLDGTWRLVPVEAILQQVEAVFGERSAGSAPLPQFAQAALLEEDRMQDGDEDGVRVEVAYGPEAEPVRRLLTELARAREPVLLDAPAGFHGVLREYQRFGLSWLVHLRRIGFGGCLADDMGLGKTIQVLAYLLYLKEQGLGRGPHLLVCPTSLLANWRAEMQRFAPDLRIHFHHGPGRFQPGPDGRTALARAVEEADVIVTTYATATRDVKVLRDVAWDVVIADEAQNIKNAETKQARAMREVRAVQRVALTGTPMENRLEELWSINQFANPGYLGTLAWFRKTFVQPITVHGDAGAARRLHHLLRPVLLRRTKTDPAIQLELPDKWEVREYAGLTPEQAALYQGIVDQLFTGVREAASSMSRRGQILAALVRLKQVCDHPCLVVGGRSDVERSAKLRLLLDRLEDVLAEGERALVFTQFRDMGELLCDAVEQRFQVRPRFLHGGQSAGERGRIVEDFQSGRDRSPVLILSLKAGGVGLNLTGASHVFHYDRWWNPAVEDQATDRVYRIGQVKNVQVHKLVCVGTLEERIDELITAKRQLSERVVGSSEAWLTELDDETLRNLFALDAQAVEVDE